MVSAKEDTQNQVLEIEGPSCSQVSVDASSQTGEMLED